MVLVGIPSSLVAREALTRVFGELKQVEIYSSGAAKQVGRRVPVNHKSVKEVFLFSLLDLGLKQQQPAAEPKQLSAAEVEPTLTVVRGNEAYTVLVGEFRRFVVGCWDRYQSGERAPYSRPYWTRKRKMGLGDYTCMMMILVRIPNAIINRKQGASGRPGMRPSQTVAYARTMFPSPI